MHTPYVHPRSHPRSLPNTPGDNHIACAHPPSLPHAFGMHTSDQYCTPTTHTPYAHPRAVPHTPRTHTPYEHPRSLPGVVLHWARVCICDTRYQPRVCLCTPGISMVRILYASCTCTIPIRTPWITPYAHPICTPEATIRNHVYRCRTEVQGKRTSSRKGIVFCLLFPRDWYQIRQISTVHFVLSEGRCATSVPDISYGVPRPIRQIILYAVRRQVTEFTSHLSSRPSSPTCESA
eukprot:3940344-Rhodomonas_salina.1